MFLAYRKDLFVSREILRVFGGNHATLSRHKTVKGRARTPKKKLNFLANIQTLNGKIVILCTSISQDRSIFDE